MVHKVASYVIAHGLVKKINKNINLSIHSVTCVGTTNLLLPSGINVVSVRERCRTLVEVVDVPLTYG